MKKSINLIFALTIVAILVVGTANAQEYINGDPDDTAGVWLYSAGQPTGPAAQPTDEIIDNAIFYGILEYIGNVNSEVIDFKTGVPEYDRGTTPPSGAIPGENSRDTTQALIVEGLTEVDDFGLIYEEDDPSSNADMGIRDDPRVAGDDDAGWFLLGNFGDVYADGVPASGILGPDVVANAGEAEDALDGCEIFIFEDATCSGYDCTLYTGGGDTIVFTIIDRQVDPEVEGEADDTLVAIDLDTLTGFDEGDYVYQIKIQDDGIPMEDPTVDEDTSIEIDAVATRVGVVLGSISGLKWHDVNENGIKDPTESTIPFWNIYLSGDAVKSTTTALDGTYIFTELPAGTYIVSEENRPGWNQTYPTPIPPGQHTVVLDVGEHRTDVNFGNVAPQSVGGEGELVTVAAITYLTILLAIATAGAALYIAFRGKLGYPKFI